MFGPLLVKRAYFYASARGGQTPLDAALSLPERCYSDLLMESASLLAVDGAYHKAIQVLERLLQVSVPVAAVETDVREQAADVGAFYATQPRPAVAEEGSILFVGQFGSSGHPARLPPESRLDLEI